MKLQSVMVRAALVAMMGTQSAIAAPASPATAAASAGAASKGAANVAAPVHGDAAELLLGGVGDHRLVLLGEMHGTRETPELVAALLQRLSARGESLVLAMEIVRQDQPAVDRYLLSSGDKVAQAQLLASSHWQNAMHDGRDSAAMLTLIEQARRLQQGGAALKVVLFDDNGPFTTPDGRDRAMAARLREAVQHNPNARVLVLTGNVHAMVRAPSFEMFSPDGKRIEPPMTAGRYLADLQPWSLRIDGAQGTMWVCMPSGCGINPVLDQGRLEQAVFKSLASDKAWDAHLLLPGFTASPPALTAGDAGD